MPIFYSNNLYTNNLEITGSITISGSWNITSSTPISIIATGSVTGTSSYSNNSATASFITASNIVGSVQSSSYSITSSNFAQALYSNLLQYTELTRACRALGSDILFEPVGGGFINAASGANRSMASGTAYGSMILVTYPCTLTGVYWIQGVAGVYTANNYNGLGLYKLTNTSTFTLVASSSNNGNTWKSASATQASASFATSYSAGVGIYMVLGAYNSSAQTTAPTIIGYRKITANPAGDISFYYGTNTLLSTAISRTSTTTLPTTITTTTNTYPAVYFALY